MKRIAWQVALAALLVCAGARSAPPEPSLSARIVYQSDDAASDCPTEPDFVSAVRERLRHGRIAEAQESAREYRVRVRRIGNRHAARLDFAEPDGTPRTREVGAEGCAEVARAIALVTALAIDAAGEEAASEAPASEGTLTASEALGLVAPSSAAPNAVVAPPPEQPVAPDAGRAPERARPHSPLGFDVGVSGTLTSSKAPHLLPGAEVFAALHGAAGAWLLELGVAGERGWTFESGPGSARFSFVGGRLRACAFALKFSGSFDATPCVQVEAGAQIAEGFIENPETRTNAWVALGPLVRFAYHLRAGTLHMQVGPTFPTNRNKLVFGPTDPPGPTVFDVPAVGVYLALGGSLGIF